MARAKTQKVQTPPAVIEERVTEIYKMLLNGATNRQIQATIKKNDLERPDKAWKMSTRTVFRYIDKARKYLTTASEADREFELGRALSRLNDVYGRAMKVNDLQRALSAQREINLIIGLYAPEPEKVIKLLGLEVKSIETLAEQLKALGEDPAALFAAMIAELAAEKNARNNATPSS